MLGSIELAIATFEQILEIDAEYLLAYKPLVDCTIEKHAKVEEARWLELRYGALSILRQKHPNTFVRDIAGRDLSSLRLSKV